MKLLQYFFTIITFGSAFSSSQTAIDMIIFSFDRPMQLFALLESIEKHVTGLAGIEVIYRTSTQEYQKGYDIVAETFSRVQFSQQGDNPRADFKPLTQQAITRSENSYVIFAVDDITVSDAVDLQDSARLLELSGAYGFYLRLGLNLSECYMLNCKQPIPAGKIVKSKPEVFEWAFANGSCDWGYPNTVDMTVYRKRDILAALESLPYNSPNTLEALWNERFSQSVSSRSGICYLGSKIVNTPLNLVQQDYLGNRHMGFMSSEYLLEQFFLGKKIDISPLYRFENKAAHMDYCPTFVNR